MSSTVYINNLNERINHKRIRDKLLRICGDFGPIASVHTSRGIRKRGQAYIAFKNRQDALACMKGLSGREIFLKPIRVALAHSDSDSVKPLEEALASQKERRKPKAEQKSATSKPVHSFGEPHSVLLLQNIPDSIQLDDLKRICSEFPKFKEARMFAVKHVGFIEFEDTESAAKVVEEISSKEIGDVTFAKK